MTRFFKTASLFEIPPSSSKKHHSATMHAVPVVSGVISAPIPDTRRPSSVNPSERAKRRVEALGLETPLPIKYRASAVPKTAWEAIHAPQGGAPPVVGDSVSVYQMYTRPASCLVKDHRNYTYREEDKKGQRVAERPKPTPLFHLDRAVLSREPNEVLGKSLTTKPRTDTTFRDDFELYLLRRTCICDIYRSAQAYFVRKSISMESIDDQAYQEATDLCEALFGMSLTKEQVLTYCFHETELTGDVYKFYHHKLLPDYASKVEDRISFFCLSLDPPRYPTWGGEVPIRPCLFTSGDNSENKKLEGDYLEKARLISKAFCKGPFVKDADGAWIEMPEIAALENYTIIANANSEIAEGKSALEAQTPKKLLKIGSEGPRRYYVDQSTQIEISPACAAIVGLSLTALDNIVGKFKSALPRRVRQKVRFPSEELRLARALEASRQGKKRGRARVGGRLGALERSKDAAKKRVRAMVEVVGDKHTLERMWKAVKENRGVAAGHAPASIDALQDDIVRSVFEEAAVPDASDEMEADV